MGKIYVGQTALKFIADTGVDITTVTAQLLKFIKPGGIEGSWLAVRETPYADGLISYTVGNDQAEVTEITCEADVAGSLNSKYWLCSSINADYYVWYNVNSAGTDPAIANKTGIEVAVATDATASDVAAATAIAMDLLADFSAVDVVAVVTVTNADKGSVTDAVDGDTGWTDAWNVTTQGKIGLDKAGKWLFWAYLSFPDTIKDLVVPGEVYEIEVYEQGQ